LDGVVSGKSDFFDRVVSNIALGDNFEFPKKFCGDMETRPTKRLDLDVAV